MVEKKLHDVPGSGTAINVIATKMDELVHCMVTRKSTGGTSPEDAMTDLLKLVFNLCAHYPKVGTQLPCMNYYWRLTLADHSSWMPKSRPPVSQLQNRTGSS